MSIESNIFKKYSPDTNICKREYEKLFLDNAFKAIVNIDDKGNVVGTVYDLENNDEFLPLRIENNEGSFAAQVRYEYEQILINIRDKYFIKNYFAFPQSNRITHTIIRKYGNEPEFLWEKFDGSGIFRNSASKKWYAAILEVEGSKIKKDKSGIIEVLDIKLDPNEIQELLRIPGFFPAYHMNKKYWITIILNDTLSDNRIMNLIEKSYQLSFAKQKKKTK